MFFKLPVRQSMLEHSFLSYLLSRRTILLHGRLKPNFIVEHSGIQL